MTSVKPPRGRVTKPLRGGVAKPLRGGVAKPLRGGVAKPLRGGVRPLPTLPREGRVLLAEALGTFGLVFLGAGAATVNHITDGAVGVVGVGMVFGLTVAAMVLAFGRTSGAHINPAVTIGLWAAGYFPAARVLPYIGAQAAGALLAGGALEALYGDSGGSLGSTVPAGAGLQSFGLEIGLTFVLMYVILSVGHTQRAPLALVAAAAGTVVGLEAIGAGPISGASMNPARSLGPAAVAGIWTDQWIYWTAPVIGAMAAVAVHALMTAPEEESGTDA